MIKEKQDWAFLMSFYNEIDNSLRNTHFPKDLTTHPNVTYNLLEKLYYLPKRNIWNL